MVNTSPSRPIGLTQREVDDLAAGRHDLAASRLAALRAPEPEPLQALRNSSPVALSAKDLRAIAESGVASARVLKAIAAAAPAHGPSKGKAKHASTAKAAASAPSLKPPATE
jgi:hypothetical protein